MLVRRIYVGQKYPHIYTLSISTCKNQSLEIHGALYIPTYEYNYKVITRYDTILLFSIDLQRGKLTIKRVEELNYKYS